MTTIKIFCVAAFYLVFLTIFVVADNNLNCTFKIDSELNCHDYGNTNSSNKTLKKIIIPRNSNVRTVIKDLSVKNSSFFYMENDAFHNFGDIDFLDLSLNNFSAINAQAFKSLKNLKTLDLSNNSLFKLKPVFFSSMTKIQDLYLSNNLLSILSTDPPPFPTLTELEKLVLSDNVIIHLPTLLHRDNSKLTYLEASNVRVILGSNPFQWTRDLKLLDLKNADLQKIPSNLFIPCKNLTFLILSENNFEELPNSLFSSLRELVYLDLSSNNLSTVHLGEHPRLKFLDLSVNRILRLRPDTFNSVIDIEELCLSNNHLEDLPPSLFDPLANLNTLRLSHNNLTDVLLKNNSKLKDLDLSSNAFIRLRPDMFNSTPNLECLDLSKNKITRLESSIFENLPNLEHVDLSSNQLSLPSNIFSFNRKLTKVDLSFIGLLEVPAALLSNDHLEKLNMSGNQLTTFPFDHLASSPKIKTLDLSGNKLMTASHLELEDFKELTLLDLSSNKLSCLPRNMFSVVHQGLKIRLHGNPWDCRCLQEMVMKRSLTIEIDIFNDVASTSCL